MHRVAEPRRARHRAARVRTHTAGKAHAGGRWNCTPERSPEVRPGYTAIDTYRVPAAVVLFMTPAARLSGSLHETARSLLPARPRRHRAGRHHALRVLGD